MDYAANVTTLVIKCLPAPNAKLDKLSRRRGSVP